MDISPSPLPEGQDLAELKRVAEAVSTPGDIDSAPESGEYGYKETAQWLACPTCEGEGSVDGATYCNFDGQPLGVQFFGIGATPGEWEAYFRAFPPKVILRLLSELETARGERDEARADRDELISVGARWTGRCYDAEARLTQQYDALWDLTAQLAQTQNFLGGPLKVSYKRARAACLAEYGRRLPKEAEKLAVSPVSDDDRTLVTYLRARASDHDEVSQKAADLIERLERERDAQRMLANVLSGKLERRTSAVERLEANLSRALEALEPFAKIKPSSFYSDDGSEAEEYIVLLRDRYANPRDFTGADLRRASEVFTSLSEKGESQ